MSVASTLSEVPLFSQLRESDIAGLANVTQERSYPKNSLILFADDPSDALYVVLSGQVKIVLGAEDGREVILGIHGEGEFFGEMSLIDDEPRSAHVIAMENSKLLILRRDDFNRCLREMPEIAEYQVDIETVHHLDELSLSIEPEPGCADPAGLVRRLQKALQDALALRVPVTVVAPGTLPRYEMKARRWIRKAILPGSAPG